MGLRRRLLLVQATTLLIVSGGALAGWGLSSWITHRASRQERRLNHVRHQISHTGFDLLAAIPHTGEYLLADPDSQTVLLHRDIAGLRQFRRELDEHLRSLVLADSDPAVHRELESIRLLSVQVERNLERALSALQRSRQSGRPVDPLALQQTVRDPAIPLMRRHGELLAALEEKLDGESQILNQQQLQAVELGLMVWAGVLLLAWLLGLLLAWRTSSRILAPLLQLERLMREPSEQLTVQLKQELFQQAPQEIASLSQSFGALSERLQQLVAELERQTRTDSLTQVGNRRHFDAVLQSEWQRAQRQQTPLSLLLLDVDHFKLYNDHYGHSQGDRCLQQVAAAIGTRVRRSGDVLCRIGGEEFAVLLPATDVEEARQLAERILSAIDDLALPHAGSTVAPFVTASIGVASCRPQSQQEPSRLMERTDAALYTRKKRLGRHGVAVATAQD